MAIDTQEKRMSAAGAGRPFMRAKLPGANDQAWRMASGHAYAGNAIGTGIVTADVISFGEVEVEVPVMIGATVGLSGLDSLSVSTPKLDSVEVLPG